MNLTSLRYDVVSNPYPPAPALTGRVAREPDDICGRPVRKGEEIAILPWVLHRHRTLWDGPDRFDPERFSGREVRPGRASPICRSAADHASPLARSLPLPRFCFLVATIAQRYRLRLVPGQDIVLLHRVTMRPRDGIR